jgi:hypothetical protein
MPFSVKKIKGIDTSDLEKLGASVVDLAKYTEDEFSQVASALQGTDPNPIWNVPLPRPRRGTTIYADGTHWNPGSGEGPYWFDGTTYHPMGQGAITDAPSDGNIYGRRNGVWVPTPFWNYLAGLTLSTAGASATFSVAAGQAADRNNTTIMTLASAISKTTAAWVVGSGNGGLDTGAVAINTIYHMHEIQRPDTGVVDACYSLSATAPTLGVNIPAAYTLSRRIGSMKTNASSQWILLHQRGDEFLWDVPVLDAVTAAITSVSRTLYTLSVPTGVQVNVLANLQIASSAGSVTFLASSPDESDVPAGYGAGGGGNQCRTTVANDAANAAVNVRTNTSAQIGGRASSTSGSISIATHGWIDTRGRI